MGKAYIAAWFLSSWSSHGEGATADEEFVFIGWCGVIDHKGEFSKAFCVVALKVVVIELRMAIAREIHVTEGAYDPKVL